MRIVRGVDEVRAALAAPRRDGARIALVPTMGAYHDGHLALFRLAAAECDVVVASLFVNPAQFGPGEDLARYPRDEARDAELAAGAGVALLFAPAPEAVYPPGFQTWVEVTELGAALEGESRPGHFRGVATVCLKLFNVVGPDVAYFGEKDAQQLAVVRQMVRDLDLPVEIRAVPTVRADDGLAQSSRNAYLSAAERARALALPRALAAGAEAHRRGEDPVAAARAVLGPISTDYVAVADFAGPRLLAAIHIGATRLIDNVALTEDGT